METKDVKRIIDEYFGTANHRSKVDVVGNIVHVNITYYDFKPISVVRQYLEEHIPYCIVEGIDRRYSDRVLISELLSIYDNEILVLTQDGDKEKLIELPLYVEERLFGREID